MTSLATAVGAEVDAAVVARRPVRVPRPAEPTFRCASSTSSRRRPRTATGCMDCDYGPAYRYHHRVLKLLQWHRPPNRWRLKTPAHMFAIDALDAVYPDAKFVITHRDSTKVIPSVASVETAVVRMYTGTADPLYFGKHCVDDWDHRPAALHRVPRPCRRGPLLRHRVRRPAGRPGRERARPLRVARRRAAPRRPPPRCRPGGTASQEDRSTGGGHHYTAEEFGLNDDELQERFAYYAERFPIARPWSTR